MNTKNIKAVIFDMDGTLIDTEKYYRMFWPKALAHEPDPSASDPSDDPDGCEAI